jgi:Lhr-like helicase
MALWFFQRTAPGEIRRISNPSMQRFLVGERPLPGDGDGFVRCIGMSLEMHARKPAQVARVWFSKIRVREDGRVDPHHRHETAKLAQQVDELVHAHGGPSVVVATHRFAERRLSHLGEWRPEQRDLEALRAVVNTKAGRVML